MTTHPSTPREWHPRPWLALAVLVALVPFFAACPPERVDPVEPVEEGALTSVAALIDAVDPAALDGREARLLNVRVVEVLGDTAFYVTDYRVAPAPAAPADAAAPANPAPQDAQAGQADAMAQPAPQAPQQRVLVVWHTAPPNAAGEEVAAAFHQVVRVDAHVDVFGTVRVRGAAGQADAPQADQVRVYVQADRVEPAVAATPAPADPAAADPEAGAPAPGADGVPTY